MAKTVEFTNFRPASTAKNHSSIVFVHGLTGDVVKNCRRIPEFLCADPRLNEWNLLGVGHQSNRRFDLTGLWSSDALLGEIANMLHARPASSIEEQALPFADLCRLGKAYGDKLATAYEGKP